MAAWNLTVRDEINEEPLDDHPPSLEMELGVLTDYGIRHGN